jgi:hypothetical protein
MSVRTRTLTGVAILTTLAALVLAAGVLANPLLSGYGGPGQGQQAILGGGLVNPPAGGSGAGGSGTASGSQLTVPASGPSASAVHSGTAKHTHGKAGATTKHAGSERSAAVPVSPQSAAKLQRVSDTASASTLGLSGGELLLIVLGLATLAVTAVLTRQLTRRTP